MNMMIFVAISIIIGTSYLCHLRQKTLRSQSADWLEYLEAIFLAQYPWSIPGRVYDGQGESSVFATSPCSVCSVGYS